MPKHVKARRAICHVLIGVGAKVHSSVETSGHQEFDQDRHDVTVDAFKAVNRAIDSLASLFPHAFAILGEASGGHQLGAGVRIKQTWFKLRLQRLYLWTVDKFL